MSTEKQNLAPNTVPECIYSLRSECLVDIHHLIRELKLNDENFDEYKFKIIPDDGFFPDAEFEFGSQLTLQSIQDIIRSIPDGHVMLQTLRAVPLAQNDLMRDRSVEWVIAECPPANT